MTTKPLTVGDVLQWVSARVRWYRGSRKLLRARPPEPPPTKAKIVQNAISSATGMNFMDKAYIRKMMYDCLLIHYDQCEVHGSWYLKGFWCASCRPDKAEELAAIPHSQLSKNVKWEYVVDHRSMGTELVWVDNGKRICSMYLSDVLTKLHTLHAY